MQKSLLQSKVSFVLNLDAMVGKEQAGSNLLLVLAFKKLLGGRFRVQLQPSGRTLHLYVCFETL